MAAAGRVLVYGGKGALGSVIVDQFKAKNWVRSVDKFCDERPRRMFRILSVCLVGGIDRPISK